jgi:hypothetical protein
MFTRLRIAIYCVSVIVVGIVLSGAANLLNESSDLSVGLGLLAILGVCILFPWFTVKLFYKKGTDTDE